MGHAVADADRAREVPGPPQHPIWGNTLEFHKEPLDFVINCAKTYGDVTRFRVGIENWYMLAHPDDVWDVLVNKASKFNKPKIAKRLWKDFLGNGLVASDGDFWKRQHKMVLPGFHRERIHAYGEIMVAYTERMIAEWNEGATLDVCQEMTSLTLAIVAKTLFDADVRSDAAIVGHAMEVLNEALSTHVKFPINFPKWWPSKLNRDKHGAIQDVDGIIRRIIAERRASGQDHGDLLSLLVFAESESGERMNDKELRDEAMTLFFAGHETTAIALTWMWYILASRPEIEAKMVAEMQDVLQDRPMTVSDLPNLPYLAMVVKECMRFLPSVWSYMRAPIEDYPVRDYVIEKGANVFISPYIMQHDPRWFDQPNQFRPERFTKENEARLPKGAYVPFSAGPRVCIGKAFAQMEANLVLGTMVRRARPNVPKDFELELLPRLSLRPLHGIPSSVQLRKAD